MSRRLASGARRLVRGLLALAWLSGAGAGAREVRLTLLCTTDLHGRVLPAFAAEPGDEAGSLLRCATLVERARRTEPNVLLLDCGDAYQGSAESWLTHGDIMVRAMRWLRYDACALGNHDFDWGLPALARLVATQSMPVLAADLAVPPGVDHPLPSVRGFVVREIDGVKVALVGLATPGIPSWLRPDGLGGLQLLPSVKALTRVMPQVREADPDVLVLLAHQGYQPGGDDFANQVRQIAANFPEFDVILGGHQHVVIPGAQIQGVLYVQAGCHAQVLGRVRLVYDTVRRRVVRREADMLPVDAGVPECRELREVLRADLDRTAAYLYEEVGRCTNDFTARPDKGGLSPVQQLICAAIAEKTGADVVLHGLLADYPLRAGPVRQRDIWGVIPYENRVACAWLTPAEITALLEENAGLLESRYYMGVYGLSYELRPDAPPGRRVRGVRGEHGEVIHARKRLKVAFNSFTAASGGQRFPQLRRIIEEPQARLEMTAFDTREALTDYVRKHRPLKAPWRAQVRVVREPRR